MVCTLKVNSAKDQVLSNILDLIIYMGKRESIQLCGSVDVESSLQPCIGEEGKHPAVWIC